MTESSASLQQCLCPPATGSHERGWLIFERPKAFIPTEDQGYLICVIQTPDGTSGEKTAEVLRRVEALARDQEGVKHTVALEGLNVITSTNQTNSGVVFARPDRFVFDGSAYQR